MIFHLKEGQLRELEENPFARESDIQAFFEAHLSAITGYRLLQTEFAVGSYRMDSVAYDEEQKAFVIIEYKRGQNETLVDQGYAYLKTVLDRRADFVLLYNEKTGEARGISHFDWSQTRIMFVSPKFTKYQIDATHFDNAAFELYEIKRYGEGIVHVRQIQHERLAGAGSYAMLRNTAKSKAPDSVAKQVEKVIKAYNLDYHYQKSKASQFVRDVYEELRDRILEFEPSLFEAFTKHYIVFKYSSKNNIVSFWLRSETIEVVLSVKRGEITDPYGMTYDISNRQWSSDQYAFLINSETNLDDAMDLIRRTYKAKIQRMKR